MKTTQLMCRASIAIWLTVTLRAPLSAGQALDFTVTQKKEPPGAPTGTAASVPLRLSLEDALALARKNSTVFHAAVVSSALAHEDRTQARDALLPQVSYNNQFIYTQGNGTPSGRNIANNGVHEYISQGAVHQAIDLAAFANYRKTSAAAAAARARAEIASRGLVAVVVQRFFAVLSDQYKLHTAQNALEEGKHFLELTQELERGGEIARSDVIKAELKKQERERQVQEAQLSLVNARLDLAVLLFSDFNENFELTDDLHKSVALPTLNEVQQQAARDNPNVRAALEAVREAGSELTMMRVGYLPSLSLDYFYGIDASQFAVNSMVDSRKIPNLGYSASATLNIPVWNWGATRSRVKQAELRRTQAQRELEFARRTLLAEMQSLYKEAETAQNELSGLGRSVDLAVESLRLTTLRYKDGEATVLEVVEAQDAYVLANNSYQDGAARYRVALANLQTLTGVLTAP